MTGADRVALIALGATLAIQIYTSLATIATSVLAPDRWPRLAIVALAALYGATATGRNGVRLAELARHAPAGKAGPITGASGVATFSGVVPGPPLFALLSAATESYGAGFAAAAALSAGAGLALALRRRR